MAINEVTWVVGRSATRASWDCLVKSRAAVLRGVGMNWEIAEIDLAPPFEGVDLHAMVN